MLSSQWLIGLLCLNTVCLMRYDLITAINLIFEPSQLLSAMDSYFKIRLTAVFY